MQGAPPKPVLLGWVVQLCCYEIAVVRSWHVQEYQDALQLRASRHRRRDSGGFAPVREKDQRFQKAVKGQRSCLLSCGGRSCRHLGAASAFAGNQRPAEGQGRRGGKGKGPRCPAIWGVRRYLLFQSV